MKRKPTRRKNAMAKAYVKRTPKKPSKIGRPATGKRSRTRFESGAS